MSSKKKSSSFQVPIRKQESLNDEGHADKEEQQNSSSLIHVNPMLISKDAGGSSPPMDDDHETIMIDDESDSELPIICTGASKDSLVISQNTLSLSAETNNGNHEIILVEEDIEQIHKKSLSQKKETLSQPEMKKSLSQPQKKYSLSQPEKKTPVKPKFVQKFISKPPAVNTGINDEVKMTNKDPVQTNAPSQVKKTSSTKRPKDMQKSNDKGRTAKTVVKSKKVSYPDEYYKNLFDSVIMKAMAMSVEKSNTHKEITGPQCADESLKEADVPHEGAATKIKKKETLSKPHTTMVLEQKATHSLENSPKQKSLSQKSVGSLSTPVLKRLSTPKRLMLPEQNDNSQKVKKFTETSGISQSQKEQILSQANQHSQTQRSQFSQSQKSGASQGTSQILFSPVPVNLTPKSQLSWIEERRDVGVWVQCEIEHCHKWRYLADTKDPLDVPQYWVCSMNPDPQFSSCDKPEKGPSALQEEDLIHNLYTSGSIVWAKVQGFPWWPAMICDCPDYLKYYWLNYFSDIPTDYHVVFFDAKNVPVTRAWLKPNALHSYTGFEKARKFEASGKHGYSERIAAAKKMAEDAMKLPLSDRRKKYSFLARYGGPIGKKDKQFSFCDVAPYAGSQLIVDEDCSSDIFASDKDDDNNIRPRKKLKRKRSKFQKQKK